MRLIPQGMNREPLPHIGRAAWEMERRGIATARGQKLKEVQVRNAGRA
jgi:hypothetical protein